MNESLPRRGLAGAGLGRWSQADWLMVGLVIVWGANFSVAKVALRTFPPMAFGALRLACAALTLLALLALRHEALIPPVAGTGRGRERQLTRWAGRRWAGRRWAPVVLLGLLGQAVYQAFFLLGLSLTTPAHGSIILALSPVFVGLIGFYLSRERIGRHTWLGIFLSFAGVLLLMLQSASGGAAGSTLGGDLLMLLATACWAVFTVASRPFLSQYSALQWNSLGLLAGTPALALVALPQLLAVDWKTVPGAAWGGVVFAGAVGMGLCYVIWMIGVQRLGSARAAVYQNAVPVVAIAVSWLMLGDALRLWQVLGAVLVLAGIGLTRRPVRQQDAIL